MVLGLLAVISALVLLDYLGYGNLQPIKGVFQIPGYPVVGNLFQVLNNPAQVYMNWTDKYKTPVFQVRLGTKRVVVVNSFEDVTSLWIKNSCANNSRPVSYTFHEIVSRTRGFTVGSTPACPAFKREKKAISQYLNLRAIEEFKPILDEEVKYMISQLIKKNNELSGPPSCNMFTHSRCELADIDLQYYFQQFALRSSIFLAFGIHLDCFRRDSAFCDEIVHVESQIMKFRSPVANLQDFLPILRYLPGQANEASKYRERRDLYMDQLYKEMCNRIEKGDMEAHSSIVGRILADQKINKLTEDEISSICLTLISAGLDNTALNVNHLMGHFSQPFYGDALQDRAYSELLSLSDGSLCAAWDDSINIISHYVMALVQETLRYFSVLPLSLPRITTKPISFKGAVIPKETLLVMNAFAANHDPAMFERPYEFLPDRWLDPNSHLLVEKHDLFHYAFGAGSRMCSGVNFALNEMYTLTCRIVLYFRIKAPTGSTLMDLDPFSNNSNPSATSFEPKIFKVRLEPRYSVDSDKLYFKINRS
ncbi:cytochrome P450 [Scheffersomyces xylosifermentans]|uniref:cytochrome P450 n=1 Tax=Scheffersomyces xylosifermentans TaxID=1304137 RepID=UPI00315C868D